MIGFTIKQQCQNLLFVSNTYLKISIHYVVKCIYKGKLFVKKGTSLYEEEYTFSTFIGSCDFAVGVIFVHYGVVLIFEENFCYKALKLT